LSILSRDLRKHHESLVAVEVKREGQAF
jgi:hypothetical protein